MIFFTLEYILTHISFSIISIVITIHLMTFLVHEIVGLRDSSEKGIIATFFCIMGLLITRWIYSGHFPLSAITAITAPSAIFTQGFATPGLSTEIHQSAILVPALQSQ